MEATLIYFGKSAMTLAIFYLLFHFVFRKQKQFVFNRLYLLASFVLSFIIPAITITITKNVAPAPVQPLMDVPLAIPDFPVIEAPATEIVEPFNWMNYLLYAFIAGIAISLVHLLIGHIRAISIVRKADIDEYSSTRICITKEDLHPFSFFNQIIVSRNALAHPNIDLIIEHEKVHVKEMHTLDMLLAELLFAMQWFNPFAWLLKDSIKTNLEYIADHKVSHPGNR